MAPSKKSAPPKKKAASRKATAKTPAAKTAPAEKPAAKGATPKRKTEPRTGLPSKKEILEFLETTSAKAGKREIARAFGIKGSDRIALKSLLREMAGDGLIAGSRRKLTRPGALPSVTVLEIASRDADGEFVARPATWDEEDGPAPRVLMVESRGNPGPTPASATACWRGSLRKARTRTIPTMPAPSRSCRAPRRAVSSGYSVL
ncbi:MAG: hypothetical protein A49_23460 [Methyloceanibacter sp.]|nr:MAG: hypothetical protein A49_23460 [Methyloceanibacter sp.]